MEGPKRCEGVPGNVYTGLLELFDLMNLSESNVLASASCGSETLKTDPSPRGQVTMVTGRGGQTAGTGLRRL